MPIEIRELVIRASIDKKKQVNQKVDFSEKEKEKLKKEILSYCLQNIERPIEKKINNPINR
jgi:hypothetical protein